MVPLKCTKNLFYSIIDSKIKPNFIFAGSFLMFEKLPNIIKGFQLNDNDNES